MWIRAFMFCRRIKNAYAIICGAVEELLSETCILDHGQLQGWTPEEGVQVGVDHTAHALYDHLHNRVEAAT